VVPVLLMAQWIKDSHVGLCVLSTQLKATFGQCRMLSSSKGYCGGGHRSSFYLNNGYTFLKGIDERFVVPKAFLRTGRNEMEHGEKRSKTTAKISVCVACGNSALIF